MKKTYTPENPVKRYRSKGNCISQPSIFREYVSLQAGIPSSHVFPCAEASTFKNQKRFFHESIATIYRMQNGTACPKKGGQWEGLAIYLPGFVCTANSGSSPHVYIPSKIIQIHGHVSIRFIFNHYVQKKTPQLNHFMFSFPEKLYNPPGGL